MFPSNSSDPALNEKPTRTAKTETDYLRRALWFEAHAATLMSVANPDPREVAACAIHKKLEWAHSTWRQVKASLVFRYTAMNTSSSLEAVRALQGEGQAECVKKSKNTSSLRRKSVSDEDLQVVIMKIRECRSQYGPILESWMLLGSTFGLRPHEWCYTSLTKVRPSEIEGIPQSDDEPRWYLRIQNGKTTNGRGHGAFRHLDISECSRAVIEATTEFAALMGSVGDNDLYDRYYNGCQRLLTRINVKLHRKGTRVIQLYSVRHHFSSMAKNRFSIAEIGAMMGHATDKTASEHYGRRVSGHSAVGVRPASIEVARVRRKKKPLPTGVFGKSVSVQGKGIGMGAGTKKSKGSKRSAVPPTSSNS